MPSKTKQSAKPPAASDKVEETENASGGLSAPLMGIVVVLCATGILVVAITQFGINIPHVSPIAQKFGIVPPAKTVAPPSEPVVSNDVDDGPVEEPVAVEEVQEESENEDNSVEKEHEQPIDASVKDTPESQEEPFFVSEDAPEEVEEVETKAEEASEEIQESVVVDEKAPAAEETVEEALNAVDEEAPVADEEAPAVSEEAPVPEETVVEAPLAEEEASAVEEVHAAEEEAPATEDLEEALVAEEAVEEASVVEEEKPATEEAPVAEEAVEEASDVEEEKPATEEAHVAEEAVEEASDVEEASAVEDPPAAEEEKPATEEASVAEETVGEAPAVEEASAVEETSVVEEAPPVEVEAPATEEPPAAEETTEAVKEVPAVDEIAQTVEEAPAVEEDAAPDGKEARDIEEVPVAEETAEAEEEAPVVDDEATDIPAYLSDEEKSKWSELKASFELLESDPSAAKGQFDELNKELGGKCYIAMHGSALASEKLIKVDPKQERNAIQAYRVLVNFGSKLPKEIMKPALTSVVDLLIRSGRVRMAVSTLEKYLPHHADDQDLTLLLVDTHIHNDNPEKAIEVASSLDPDATNVKVLLARAHKLHWDKNREHVGALSKAAEILQSVEAKTREIVIMLGECLERSGQHDQALDVYTAAVSAGLLPSVYQRPDVLTPGLRSEAVWSELDLPGVGLTAEDKEQIVQSVIYKGLFGEMEGDNGKEGVWGYFGLSENGAWQSEECKAIPTVCKKLKAAGYGTVGKTYVSLLYPASATYPHTAPSNELLHLIIPTSGAANLRIADKNIDLSTDPVVIDPSFEKDFSNNGETVAVLIVTAIPHPGL